MKKGHYCYVGIGWIKEKLDNKLPWTKTEKRTAMSDLINMPSYKGSLIRDDKYRMNYDNGNTAEIMATVLRIVTNRDDITVRGMWQVVIPSDVMAILVEFLTYKQ